MPSIGAVAGVDLTGDLRVTLPLGCEPRDALPGRHELRDIDHVARHARPAQQQVVGVHGVRERFHRVDPLGAVDHRPVAGTATQVGGQRAGPGAARSGRHMARSGRNREARHLDHAAVR